MSKISTATDFGKHLAQKNIEMMKKEISKRRHMKTEAEIREALRKCEEQRDYEAIPEDCPFGNICCPECGIPFGLYWVLGEIDVGE